MIKRRMLCLKILILLCVTQAYNPFQHDKILDKSKFKEVADDNYGISLSTVMMNGGWIRVVFIVISTGCVFCNDDLVPGNWDNCRNGKIPPTRVDTSSRVAALRALFISEGIHAYVIPNEDAHQSEYPSDYDKRRGYISGFQGSAGFAVVTRTKLALWTDGRYFLEAEDTLDCNWILMRQGVEGVPGMTEWLRGELTSGELVGASPSLIGSSSWLRHEEDLAKTGMAMKQVQKDLIDEIWSGTDRPEQPNTHLYVLPDKFSGRTWQDKISDMRNAMHSDEADMMVVTSLDETAWLFNLRASDISYNPFFISYAIVEMNRIRLYIKDSVTKLSAKDLESDPSNMTVAEHLNTNPNTGLCSDQTGECVEVLEYNASNILMDVNTSAAVATKVLLSYSCNYAIYSSVPMEKIIQKNTPVATTKTKKNTVERQDMKNSHIRDAVALISFIAKLEKEVKAGIRWTELSAAEDLKKYRSEQQYNRGLSFNSISGSGSNGAIIHYRVTNLTDKPITTSEMYLLDSGGQYLDGTTDVTRTFHFGKPTDYEKDCYTRVLMGHIDLFQLHWPRGLYGRELESFARAPLWKAGLVYRHGTGHGIGMFLSVHEGPGRISGIRTLYETDNILDDGQFFSDEPGYYETGKFGIRLENIVMVTNSTLQNTFDNLQFLTFEHITLVPYEPNLIKYDMLNKDQIDYLNAYHELVKENVGPELQKQGQTEGYNWMMDRVIPVTQFGPVSAVTTIHGRISFVMVSLILIFVFVYN